MRRSRTLGLALLALAGCGGGTADRTVAPPPLVRTPADVDVSPARPVARIAVGGTPCGLAVAAGAVWVTDAERAALLRIDPRDNRITHRVELPHPGCDITASEQRLYVDANTQGAVDVVDIATRRVVRRFRGTVPLNARVPYAQRARAAVAGASVYWSTDPLGGVVTRFREDTGLVERRFPGFGSSSAGPVDVAFAGDRLWVANLDGTVQRADPATGRRDAPPLRVSTAPPLLAGTETDLWWADAGSGRIGRVDPATGRTTVRFAAGGGRLAVDRGTVWAVGGAPVRATVDFKGDRLRVRQPQPLLWRIDARARRIVGVTAIGRSPSARARRAETGPPPLTDVTVGYGSVWVTSTVDRALYRLPAG